MIVFFVYIGAAAYAAPTTLKTRLQSGAVGDYVVTAQDKSFSMLRIREKTESRLVLEEITAPESRLDLNNLSWTKWLEQRAPGHSAWLLYEIDLNTGKLLECFSVSQRSWISVEEPILPKMLNLPLSQVDNEKRRRIGPQPQKSEEDTRALWIPPVTFEGAKLNKPSLEVLETRWPDDASELAGCHLELYFLPGFALPFWIETSNGHFTLKMRSVACGKASHSPIKMPMPHRPQK